MGFGFGNTSCEQKETELTTHDESEMMVLAAWAVFHACAAWGVMIAIIINQIQVMASSALVCLYYDKEIMDVT